MPRPAREPPTPSVIVPALLRYVGERTGDAAPLATRLGLPADAAERDELLVDPLLLGDAIEVAAGLLGEPFLALALPGALPLRRYAVAELAVRASATVRDALALLVRHAAIVHPLIEVALDDGPDAPVDEALWIQRTPRHPRGLGRCAHEYALADTVHKLRTALGAPLPLRRVWFAHARPRRIEPLARWFGDAELAFGAPDCGFALALDQLDRPLPGGDPRLVATFAALADADARAEPRSLAIAPRVTAALRARLAGPIAADDVAAALHMSARTLQRRLEAEGASFSALLDAVREQVARELLADRALGLAEIAGRIGFADLATFSRAFKRWTGVPPGQYRSRLSR